MPHSKQRTSVPTEIAQRVLILSKRRCSLCDGLEGDQTVKEGQFAHIDRNPENSQEENLVYLCLKHHNLYDTTYRQSKRFTPDEIKHYKKTLYRSLGTAPAQWELLIEGSLVEFDSKRIDLVMHTLGELLDGCEVRLKHVVEGSIVLRLESNESVFQAAKELFDNGTLSTGLDVAVIEVRRFQDAKAKSRILLSQELLDDGLLEEALACFTQLTNEYPQYPAAWAGKSAVLLELYRLNDMGGECEKRLLESYSCCCRALELCRDDPAIWANKGAVLFELNRIEDALRSFERAIELDSNNAFAWYNKGATLYNLGNHIEAIEALEVSAKLGDQQAMKALVLARARCWKPRRQD